MFVHVRSTPSARKERVTKVSATEFHIAVREPAERNMANKRIVELLAIALGTIPKHVTMLTGHRSPSKMFSVETK